MSGPGKQVQGIMACSNPGDRLLGRSEARAVHVRVLTGEDHMDLNFVLKGKSHKMHRPVDEPLGRTLKRLLMSVNKSDKHQKKIKRKTGSTNTHQSSVTEAHVYSRHNSERVIVPEVVPNINAWVDGSCLIVDGVTYSITVNVPTVCSLKISECVLIGSAAIPEVRPYFLSLSVTLKLFVLNFMSKKHSFSNDCSS